MNSERSLPTISVVDTIGVHSGMQHYDEALAGVLEEAGFRVDVVSNFTPSWWKPSRPPVLRNFYPGNFLQKLGRLAISFLTYLGYVLKRASRDRQWWIYQSYGLRVIDFIFLLPLLPMRKRVILLIHDVFSITSPEGRFKRWIKTKFYRAIPRQIILHSPKARVMLEKAGYKGMFLEIPHFPAGVLAEGIPVTMRDDVRSAVDHQDRLILLLFGSLRPSKGLDTALAAIRSMPYELRQSLHLIVAGRDSNGLLGSSGYEIADDLPVTVLDRFITNEEQAFLFRRCNLLLLPYREIYQSGVVEVAIAYRVPFLASDLATFSEILVNHPSFGFIYGHSAEELASHLKRFIQQPETLRQAYRKEEIHAHSHPVQRDLFINALRNLTDPTPPFIK